MKGYWYIPAISVVCAILFTYFKNYFVIIVFIIWLGILFSFKRLEKLPIVVSLTFFLFFLHYIPDMNNTNAEDTTTQKRFHGEIISEVMKTSNKMEFQFRDYNTRYKYAVVYFPNQEDMSNAALKYGAVCILEGQMNLPNESRNPGQFDFRSYLMNQGILFQITLDSLEKIKCTGSKPLHYLYTLRYNLLAKVENNLSTFTASWLNSLVLGDDSLLDDETVELFQKWGLTHIIAISGTHIALLLGFMYLILIKCSILTVEKAKWFVVFILPIYAVLAGGEPSVWRSCVMATILILLQKIKIKVSMLDVLSIVFIMLLYINPYYIYHIGFQFSFLVTFSIILSVKWLGDNHHLIIQGLKVSFIAQMIILPLQINYFYFFQPMSILLNVLIIPYFSILVIPFMYSLLPLSLFPSFILRFTDYIFVKMHTFVLQFIKGFDSIFDYPWVMGFIPLGLTLIYYVLLFYFMKNIELNRSNLAFRSGIILCIFLFFLVVKPYFSSTGKVMMLDIGQGDAIVIELPYRKAVIMIDAGASFSFIDGKVSKNVYKQIIKPYLYSQGIQKIDALILTHEDLDHVGSVPFLLQDGIVHRIYVHPYYGQSVEERMLWKDFEGISVGNGYVLDINGQKFYVLGPIKDAGNANNNSIVIFAEIGGLKWLFTGDIGKEVEKELLRHYPNLTVDVLKVGHHGSNTSTDELFLDKLTPHIALIPVGKKNNYGHPSPEVIKRLQDRDIVILRTDKHGAIEYRFRENTGTFSTYLPYYDHE